MRRLLTSTAAFALLAVPAFFTPAWSDPPSDRVGKASVAPQVQDRAQAELRHESPPQQQGGGRSEHDRVGNRGGGPAAQATIQPPENRGERGNWQGRGDRGGAPQATIQAPANRGERGNWQGRGDRSDPGYWRGDARPDRRDGDNRRDFNSGDFNRDGRTDYRPSFRPYDRQGYGGPRHDFSGFRDYHRNFYASRRFRAPFYRRPAGWYDHRWSFGEFLPSAFWARDYWLVDFEAYDLPPPPYGAVWVRVGNDALLVDEESGEIISVAYDIFY
ncbi:MAG TPA: RcnB family protein [Rhizomicrobium sp.]|nr:RcnB family protein [Rhizomicrobium sp.]